MTRTSRPQEAAPQRSCTSALDDEHPERAAHERAGEAEDLAHQFVATLRAMRPSDWLDLGLVF
jgi:hypothetical protein